MPYKNAKKKQKLKSNTYEFIINDRDILPVWHYLIFHGPRLVVSASNLYKVKKYIQVT